MTTRSANPYLVQGDNPFEEPPRMTGPAPVAQPSAAAAVPQHAGMQFFDPAPGQLQNQPAYHPPAGLPPGATPAPQQYGTPMPPPPGGAAPPAGGPAMAVPPPARELETSKCWTLAFYKQFFDVDTKEVLARLANTLIPVAPPDFLLHRNWHASQQIAVPAAAGLEGQQQDVEKKPDLYGPFWVTTSLWMTLAIVGNIMSRISYSRAQQTAAANPLPVGSPTSVPTAWHYDFTSASVACATIYTFCGGMSLLVWALMKWKSVPVTLIDVLCLYGYSMFIFVCSAILCMIPMPALQLGVCVISGLWSAAYLLLNFWHVWRLSLEAWWFTVAVLCVGGAQVLLTLSFKLYFFNYSL